MPRYEFSEGTSNKFWEIMLQGKAFTTTYGKIGANGQTTIKTYKSDAEAKKEHDKLVAEKVKKGYALAGGKQAAVPAKPATATPGEARNPDLEKAINADPHDDDAYSVLGDWLQDKSDPRGELISLQLANKTKAANAVIDKHADYFYGDLAAHKKCYDGSDLDTFQWKYGFIHGVRLAHDSYADEEFAGSLAEVLSELLRHPSGRFLTHVAMNYNGDPNESTLDGIFDVLAKKAPPTIRQMLIGDNVDQISWFHLGNVGKIWKGVPGLERLEIEAGSFTLGTIDAPKLARAVFKTGGLSKASCKAIANAKIPSIEHLELYFGDENYGGDCTIKDVLPLLDRTDLKKLTYLGLKNAMFENDIAKAIGKAKIVRQLKTLDLSQGAMTDEGADALAAAKDALKHLEVLDLTRNFLSKQGIAAVKGLAKKVITADQEEADQDGDETYYYVAVAE